MPLRERDKHTRWMNHEPIANLHEALDVLYVGWREQDKYLYTGSHRADEEKPEVWLDWYSEGDSGGDSSGTYYLEIEPAVAKQLVDEGLVEPMKELGWGYTHLLQEKKMLSQAGKEMLERLIVEKQRLAHSFLKPGTHSAFSSIFNAAGRGREHHRFGGKLYFEFKTPMPSDGTLKVYPGSGRILKFNEHGELVKDFSEPEEAKQSV
jgi:hypothetical protein